MKIGQLNSILFSFLFLSFNGVVVAQKTILRGKVSDAKTHEPLPFVVVQLVGSTIGATTDLEGNFKIQTDNLEINQVKVNYVGYKPLIKNFEPGQEHVVNFKLHENTSQLQEVVVKGKKGRYRNKNNPAVELIKKVIEHKDQNRKEGFDYYEYEKYEKTQFALSNITEDFKNKRAFKKFQFVFDNLDSTKLEGKPVLPIYLKESISDVKYRREPKKKKEVVKAVKMVTFDGFVDDEGLGAYMKYMYQDINIYDNNVLLFTNQFLSPIAGLAPTFYMYHLADTLDVNGTNCIKLSFTPRNKADFLFQGDLYITKDSAYAVKKVDMSLSPDININWVKELKITQEFENHDQQGFVLTNDLLAADFGLSKNSQRGFFGQRTTSYKDFKINQVRNAKEYEGLDVEVLEKSKEKPDSFWMKSRHQELSTKEAGIYTSIDSIKKMPVFKRTMNTLIFLSAGYKSLGWFEIGPVNTFYSFNPVEGFRLRAGGRTTPKFSNKLNFETYVAYGFKDEKYKYYLGTTYSLTERTIWQFPVKSVKASYQSDTKIPGQDLQFVQEDNFLLSFKRGLNNKWLYNETFILEYLNEYRNHFSFTIGYKWWQQNPAGGLHFNKLDYNDRTTDIQYLTTSEASMVLRYAPKEIFYQGKVYRVPLVTKYPVFTLRLVSGLKGVLGGEYDYQNVTLNISKRFYLSQLGMTDVTVEAGKVFGKVPFPLLNIHRANQTYAYQLQSYNLMNFLEFVSDEYESINLDHNFNGFFFNKIPFLKRLKWRELIALKALFGSIGSMNDPKNNSELYRLPTNQDGTPITYSLQGMPYVEGSIGIGNIFKFFRVDLIRRFTYLDHPNVAQLGIRARFKFDF